MLRRSRRFFSIGRRVQRLLLLAEQLPATTATTKANLNLIRRLRQTLDMALVCVESGWRALKTPLRLPAKCGAVFKYFASWRVVGSRTSELLCVRGASNLRFRGYTSTFSVL